MKKCPYCSEEIQEEAIKCRYCGEWLEEKKSGPFIHKDLIEKEKPAETIKEIEHLDILPEEGPKKCPRCGLLNPPSGQRCDCGYDFIKKTVEKPYFKQSLPKDIKIFIYVFVPLNLIGALGAIATGNFLRIGFVAIWSIAVYSVYSRLLKKENWARIALIFLTFPWGLILGLSRETKLYCMQKD